MRFDVAVLAAHMILQLSSGGVERIANRHIEILMGAVLAGKTILPQFSSGLVSGQLSCAYSFGRAIDDYLPSRHAESDAHLKCFSFLVVTVRRFNDNAAARDARAKGFELGSSLSEVLFNGRRWRHVTKGDAQRVSHVDHPSS